MSFRPQRQRSGGIHPSCRNNRRMVKFAAWEDTSTPFHFGRDDISGVVPFNRTGYHCNVAGGKIAAPTVSLISAFVQSRVCKERPFICVRLKRDSEKLTDFLLRIRRIFGIIIMKFIISSFTSQQRSVFYHA